MDGGSAAEQRKRRAALPYPLNAPECHDYARKMSLPVIYGDDNMS